MKNWIKGIIITLVSLVATVFIYVSLSDSQKESIRETLTTHKYVVVNVDNKTLPINVSRKTFLFARDNLKEGEEIILYYKAAGNKKLCYDPHNSELLYNIPKGGIKAIFIRTIEADRYGKNGPRKSGPSSNFTTPNGQVFLCQFFFIFKKKQPIGLPFLQLIDIINIIQLLA